MRTLAMIPPAPKVPTPETLSMPPGRYIVQHALGDGASGRVLRRVLKRSLRDRYFVCPFLSSNVVWLQAANFAAYCFLTSRLLFG